MFNEKSFFSIKTFIIMYKQTIYSQQKLIKIIWLTCHKGYTLPCNLCNKDCKDKTIEEKK